MAKPVQGAGQIRCEDEGAGKHRCHQKIGREITGDIPGQRLNTGVNLLSVKKRSHGCGLGETPLRVKATIVMNFFPVRRP